MERDSFPSSNEGMAVDEIHDEFGARLRLLRRRRGLSQEELAAGVQMSVGGISNLERGLSGPRLATVAKIAKALGVDPLELFAFPGRATIKQRRIAALAQLEGKLNKVADEDFDRVVEMIEALIEFDVRGRDKS